MFNTLKSQKGLAPIIIVLIVIGIVAIGGGIYWWQKSATPTSPQGGTGGGGGEINNEGNITFTKNVLIPYGIDQTDTTSFKIARLVLEKPGFVVIHEDDNNKPGKIIGQSSLFTAGESRDLSVSVKLEAGKNYFAVLYLDNGDGQFKLENDPPAKNGQNETERRWFTVLRGE